MSIFLNRKYVGLVSHRLNLFKRKNNDLFNFRCPFCGDSEKNKTKCRGYIYAKGNDYFYRCHNCGMGTTFNQFLKQLDPSVHKQFVMEKYKEGAPKNAPNDKPDFKEMVSSDYDRLSKFQTVQIKAQTITHCFFAANPNLWVASEYIKSRKIPEEFWEEIYYTPNYKKFLMENFESVMLEDFPEERREKFPEDARIVLVYRDEEGDVVAVAGRALDEACDLRYITISIKKGVKRIYNLHKLKNYPVDKPVYVVEGQFDSYFLPNCLASGDSNLVGVQEYLIPRQCVLVYDKEPRNKELVKQINKAIVKGYTVCLLPESLPGKDLNKMIQEGMSLEELREVVERNTFVGLRAQLEFSKWKKV